MIKIKLSLSIFIIFVAFSVSAAIVEHDNVLCAYSPDDNTKVEMNIEKVDGFAITSGQPYSGTMDAPANDKKNKGCIIIKAGRKASADVANWAKLNLNPGVKWDNSNVSVIKYRSKGEKIPKELNFAVKADILFLFPKLGKMYDCKNLMITHVGSKWWIFSNEDNYGSIFGTLNLDCDYQLRMYKDPAYKDNTLVITDDTSYMIH